MENAESGPQTEPVDPDTIEASIEEIMALVEPILDGLFKAGATNSDYWLKKRSTQILSDWIISILNMNKVMEEQIRAMGIALQAQEKELEQARTAKGKMWVPGL
jgi:hypothetical protein